MKPYRLWATYYDRIFPFTCSWGAVTREQLLDPLLPHCTSVCDLACGTGTTAIELAQLGLRVYAVDLSPTMCDITRRKVRRARPPVTVIQADMRTFHLPEPVDLITCEFDAINHIPNKQDLALVAHSAARALQPGGHFYFDANNLLAFQEVWPLTWRHELPGVVIVSHGRYDAEKDRATSSAEFFIRQGKLWERHVESIQQVCWTQKEIRAALYEAGFESVRAWDAARFFPPGSMIDRGHRTIYLARKRRHA